MLIRTIILNVSFRLAKYWYILGRKRMKVTSRCWFKVFENGFSIYLFFFTNIGRKNFLLFNTITDKFVRNSAYTCKFFNS